MVGIILPLGAIEQHGPHLSLETDAYLTPSV
ncbi:MAG: creatininase family protein [Acidimicrobiales bacterium]